MLSRPAPRRRNRVTAALTSALLLAAPLTLHAQNLVTNGSFEAPVAPGGGYSTYFAGQTFGGWNVSAGSIDLIGNGFWQAADGVQSVDLDGSSAGTIYQNLATQSGQRYNLSFAMAGNPIPTFPPPVKTVNVLWGGTLVGTFTFDVTGHTFANMGYQTMSLMGLLATGSSTQLAFQSGDPAVSQDGPVLDAISVVAASPATTAPEPTTWALLAAGLGGLGALARRRARA